MGRAGVNKVQVELAMAKLRARAEYPSLDRILAITGGSKGTVKQLREEILAEQAESVADSALMKELATFNTEILQRIRHYAEREVREARARFDEQTELLESQAKTLTQTVTKYKQMLEQEAASHQQLMDAFQELQVNHARLEQQVADLTDANTTLKADKHSLDEKHRQAREALEHFRVAAKEQREREQAQHDNQVQQLRSELRQANQTMVAKQSEITQLNRDNATFVGNVAELRKQVKTLENSLTDTTAKAEEARDSQAKLAALTDEKTRLEDRLLSLTQALEAEREKGKEHELKAVKLQMELDIKNEMFAKLGVKPGREDAG